MSSGTAAMRLVCASANPDKVAEIASLLDGTIELMPRPEHVPDVIEDAPTLTGNARLKAQAICAATGLPAVADDTGLEVDALGGAPGVHTARYAGEQASYADNRAKMLAALDGVEPARRSARFRTVAMVCWPDGTELAAEGVCEGWIAEEERGDRGFGYDAVFVPGPSIDGPTFAQVSEAEKHAVSHRGRAFRALVDLLDRR
jgi:XTP/dITP diphosphohydrolase